MYTVLSFIEILPLSEEIPRHAK